MSTLQRPINYYHACTIYMVSFDILNCNICLTIFHLGLQFFGRASLFLEKGVGNSAYGPSKYNENNNIYNDKT